MPRLVIYRSKSIRRNQRWRWRLEADKRPRRRHVRRGLQRPRRMRRTRHRHLRRRIQERIRVRLVRQHVGAD